MAVTRDLSSILLCSLSALISSQISVVPSIIDVSKSHKQLRGRLTQQFCCHRWLGLSHHDLLCHICFILCYTSMDFNFVLLNWNGQEKLKNCCEKFCPHAKICPRIILSKYVSVKNCPPLPVFCRTMWAVRLHIKRQQLWILCAKVWDLKETTTKASKEITNVEGADILWSSRHACDWQRRPTQQDACWTGIIFVVGKPWQGYLSIWNSLLSPSACAVDIGNRFYVRILPGWKVLSKDILCLQILVLGQFLAENLSPSAISLYDIFWDKKLQTKSVRGQNFAARICTVGQKCCSKFDLGHFLPWQNHGCNESWTEIWD